ncbi:MAG: glycine zipper 2TM domain-containing protein [Pseudomonadota bacterium]|nr:glycine zipper 2TM domain-containing protein [Pseudomonadota bacterium]
MNFRANSLHIIGTAALALGLSLASGCASTGPGYGSSGNYNSNSGNANAGYCNTCGVVTRIETGVGSRAPNATGAVVGGVVGALAGRELAKNRTDSTGRQNTATVAGAATGALIGNSIQNRAGTGYNVYVRLDNGQQLVAMQDDLGNIREGSRVRVDNGRAYMQ